MRYCDRLKEGQVRNKLHETTPKEVKESVTINYSSCRFMKTLQNERIGFNEKHSWLQNFNLTGDKIYSSKEINGRAEESERVKEIQRKIVILREGNDLLISYIRQLFDLSQPPTRADLDYLHHLFRIDEEHLYELSESLKRGKQAIERKTAKEKEERSIWDCKGNCNCNVCGCGDIREKRLVENWIELEYVIIDTPPAPPQPPSSSVCSSIANGSAEKKCCSLKPNGLQLKDDEKLRQNLLWCPYLDFNELANMTCESYDLLEVESELEQMAGRIKTFEGYGQSKSAICDWSPEFYEGRVKDNMINSKDETETINNGELKKSVKKNKRKFKSKRECIIS